jgi:hypothetical protein
MPHEQADSAAEGRRHSFGFLGELPVSDIRPADCAVWFDMLAEELRHNPEKAERLNHLMRTLHRQD